MKPGIHHLTMPEYLALKALSSGLLNTLLVESPYHAKHEMDNPDNEATDVTDFGTAVHDALLEGVDKIEAIDPENYRSKPTKANPEGNVPKGWTNGAIKEARDIARASGRIPMLLPDVQCVQDAVAAVKEQVAKTEIAGCFDEGHPEQTIVWEEGGVLMKCRPDWRSTRWHISLKTTNGTARPEPFIRWVFGPKGYDTSLAFYRRGLAAHGIEVEHRILVAQQCAPYRVSVVGLAPGRWEYADARVERGLRTWKQCVHSGRWPAYDLRTHFAELMPYEEAQEQEVRLGMEYDQLQVQHGIQP